MLQETTQNLQEQELSRVAFYDLQIKNAKTEEERLAWQPHRDMLLLDVSLNSVCNWLGDNCNELIALREKQEKNSSVNYSKEISKLEEEADFLLNIKKQIYSGNEETMYKVYNGTRFSM